MAKPFRRRKRKGGPFVGSYFVPINGKDVNLGTKDAREAHLRARLAAVGKWPPSAAAAAAMAAALDPTAEPTAPLDVESTPAPEPPAAPPLEPPPPPAPPSQDEPRRPLHEAVADAANAAAGQEVTEEGGEPAAAAAASEDEEVRAIMAELGSAEAMDSFCDGAAAVTLKAEAWLIGAGVNWAFLRKRKRRLECATPGQTPDAIERKCLRVGYRALAARYAPALANIGPGLAILAGLSFGAVAAVIGGRVVDATTGEATEVKAVIEQAQAGGVAAAPAPAPAPAAPAPVA